MLEIRDIVVILQCGHYSEEYVLCALWPMYRQAWLANHNLDSIFWALKVRL